MKIIERLAAARMAATMTSMQFVWQKIRAQWLTLVSADGWRPAVALAIFAALVQAAFLWDIAGAPIFRFPLVDAGTYHRLAVDILKGNGVVGAFWQPPGYPYFLAFLYEMGGADPVVGRALQALLLAPLLALLLWRVGRRVVPPAWAFGAALVACVTGPLLFYFSQLLAAAPAAVLIAAVLWLALRAMERPGMVRWLLAGVATGVAILFVATSAAVIPVLLVFAWLGAPAGWRQRCKRVAAMIVGVGLIVLPVTMRNALHCGKLVWVSTNGGVNFYVGNSHDWDVSLTTQPGQDWDQMVRMPYKAGAKDSAEMDRWFERQALRDMKHHPKTALRRLIEKALVFWHGREIPRNLNIYDWRSESLLLSATVWRAGICFPVGLLVPLAVIGVVMLRRQRAVVLLATSIVAYGLLVALFFPCSRYRVPVLPVIVLFATAGVWAIAMAVREKQTRTIRMLAVALVVLVVLANMPFTWPTDSVNYNAHLWNAIGAAADTRGDKIMAKNSYQRALEFDPRFADAHFNLGSVYTRNGDDMRAEACYEGAVAARPDHDKARINLALLLAKRGRVEDALRQLTFAEMVNPLNAGAFYNHAAVLMQAGKRAEALAPLNRAAVLEPRYAPQLHVLERELNAGQKEVTR